VRQIARRVHQERREPDPESGPVTTGRAAP
jgi:hypothetical protein